MKVLLITEKLDKDDETTSFFHGRLLDFANECDALSVLVLENKSHSLPEKVKVCSLGKERGVSRFDKVFNFYKYIFAQSASYDCVFVHRNPIYIVLGGFFWRLMGKEVTLWYSHTYSDWMLHVAVFFANKVISPSRESFPFATSKLKIVRGHDLDSYVCEIK
jgi:hypothetical protein